MADLEIFKDILNDPTDINPGKYYPSNYYLNENILDTLTNLRFEYSEKNIQNKIFYHEYVKNLQKKHNQEIEKYKNYVYSSFEICESLRKKYENVLRNQKNK
jgi:hypothetical protein